MYTAIGTYYSFYMTVVLVGLCNPTKTTDTIISRCAVNKT